MSKSAQFTEYGRQCVRLAESSGGSHRALMLSMAHVWFELAEQVRRDAELESSERDIQHAA